MNARGFFLAAATLAALLLAIGCGSSSDPEVTVQTGSLSKAEFIEKADAICAAARSEFETKYASFFKAHEADFKKKQSATATLDEAIQSTIAPNLTKEIEQISELGAPSAYAPKVASFLNTLQSQLQEVEDEPTKVSATPYPFKKTEDVASKAGLNGCAESFG